MHRVVLTAHRGGRGCCKFAVCEDSELSQSFATTCALDEADTSSAHATSHALCVSGARITRARGIMFATVCDSRYFPVLKKNNPALRS